MAQLYGSNREESYAPSHGSTQDVYHVARPSRPDETNQAKIKPLVVNYYPSRSTAGPQRYIAEVQTVSQEVIRRPAAVPVKEIERDYGSHVDGRSKGDDQFIARLQDAAIKANAGKLLGLSLDQPQGVPKLPTDYQGKSTIDDRWSVQPNPFDEQNPRKVAELFNKVSNWRGTNGLDRGRSGDTYEGWSNNQSDRYKQPTQSSTMYGKGYYGGHGSQAKLDDSYAGRNSNLQAPRIGRSYTDQGGNYVGSGGQMERPFTPQGYDNHGKPGSINGNYGRPDDSYTEQTESPKGGGGGLNKPLSAQQSYGRPASYGGDTHGKPSSMRGGHDNREDGSYGNHGNVEAPRVGSGYTAKRENLNAGSGLNKPLSTHQGYDQPTSYRGNYVGSGSQIERPFTPQGYDNHGRPGSINGNYGRPDDSYTEQTESPKGGGGGLNKPLSAQQSYGQPASYGGDTHGKPSSMGGGHNNREDGSYGNHGSVEAPRVGSGYTAKRENLNGGSGLNKPLSTHQGYDQPTRYRGDNNMKPGGMSDSQQSPRAGGGYTSRADQFNGGIGWKKPIATQQVYDQPIGYGGDDRRSPISKGSDYSNSEKTGYGNTVKSGDHQGRSNNPQAPQGYDYNRPRAEYDGGKQGYGYGYGDGVDTMKQDKPGYETYGSGYNSATGPNTVKPTGINAPEITSKQAVRMYKGAFV